MAAPPNSGFLQLELMTEATRDGVQAAHGLGGNFGADAIAGQNRDQRFHACARS